MSKDAAQEARELECRVRALARHLLVGLASNSTYWDEVSTIEAVADAWEAAEQFEKQAEERWRKLL